MLLSKANYCTSDDNRSKQNQQKSNTMQVLWQVSVSLSAEHVASFFLFIRMSNISSLYLPLNFILPCQKNAYFRFQQRTGLFHEDRGQSAAQCWMHYSHLNRYFVLPKSLRALRDTELSFNPEPLIFAQNINTPLITGGLQLGSVCLFKMKSKLDLRRK